MSKVGILYDNIGGNTGGMAIGLSIKKILSETGVEFDELFPGNFNPNDYDTIIIGGGHLVRPSPDFFYDNSMILPSMKPLEIFTFISKLDYFISCSLHSGIFSYKHNVPLMKVSFDSLLRDAPDYSAKISEDLPSDFAAQAINEVSNLGKRPEQMTVQFQALENELAEMRRSIVWQMTTRFHKGIVERTLPQGSRRRRWYDTGLKAGRVLVNDGWDSLRISLQMYFNHKIYDNNYNKSISTLELTENEKDLVHKRCESFKYRPKISIIIPVWNTEEKWLKSAIDSVLNQIYDNWENAYRKNDSRIKVRFLSENLGVSGASNEAISLATGEFIGFLDHDDQLVPSALYEVVKLLNENSEADFIYSDEVLIDEGNKPQYVIYRPDFSLDYMLSHCYIVHFVAIKSDIIHKIKGFRKEFSISQDYDMFLRVLSETRKIYHIPKILYKWRQHESSAGHELNPKVRELSKKAIHDFLDREGIEGDVIDGRSFNFFRVKRKIIGYPKVTIIIPTKDQIDLLRRCIESIESKTSYRNYEIIIVDNKSQKIETLEYLKYLQTKYDNYKVIKFDDEFNYSRINNFAVNYATGDHLLFLNNDTECISSKWLEALLEHSQRKEVGCVGAKLIYPDRRIQHAGVVIGLIGLADHVYKFSSWNDIGYLGQLISIRNYSAVTAACMMVKKRTFEELKGFDENIKVGFGDIDFCLKAVEKGYLNVFTPYAELYHYESATRGKTPARDPHPKDSLYFSRKWRGIIQKGDKYYNPNLPLNTLDITRYVQMTHDV